MKKLILFVALFGMTLAYAQGPRAEKLKDATPQEIATLKSKKLTLKLDLSDSQEKQVYNLILDQATDRKANKMSREERKELTDEQKKQARVARLDAQIAFKRDMKNILTDAQYEKWEKMQAKRKMKRDKKRDRS